MSQKFKNICNKALKILSTFPKSKNGLPYLTLADGRKCFFDVFITKYGLNGEPTQYNSGDVMRRVRLVEFFDLFTKLDVVKECTRGNYVIDSEFYRMVLGRRYNNKGQVRLVLISFYNHT